MSEFHSRQTDKSTPFTVAPAEFAAEGKKRMEELASAQTELFDEFQAMNQQWLQRAQEEANLASEFVSKLTAVRSVPDAVSVYQDWVSQCFRMMAEDRKHLVDDCQKVSEMSVRLLSNGRYQNGSGVGT